MTTDRHCPSTLGHGIDCPCRGTKIIDVSCDECGEAGLCDQPWSVDPVTCPFCDGTRLADPGEPYDAELVTWVEMGWCRVSGPFGWCESPVKGDFRWGVVLHGGGGINDLDEATAICLCATGKRL